MIHAPSFWLAREKYMKRQFHQNCKRGEGIDFKGKMRFNYQIKDGYWACKIYSIFIFLTIFLDLAYFLSEGGWISSSSHSIWMALSSQICFIDSSNYIIFKTYMMPFLVGRLSLPHPRKSGSSQWTTGSCMCYFWAEAFREAGGSLACSFHALHWTSLCPDRSWWAWTPEWRHRAE